MPQPPPIVAGIYARRSIFSVNSESVANQVALCREHCERAFPGCTIVVYDEDEGFSGKDTNRPSYQRLVADIKARKINVLCCYRLDRISRSIRDFCTLLDDLQRYGVAFVSLRDNFDTSTPMGRAMLYIASVFSQLERETLAERVKDALYEMAKTGRWLGGNTPSGFEAVEVETERDGVKRSAWMLQPVPGRIDEMVDLYYAYAKLGSLTKLEQHCCVNNIKSPTGLDFNRTVLRNILSNPVYCTADADAYRWFSSGAYNLCASEKDFDGVHGIMPFNRTYKTPNSTVRKSTAEWIIAVGRHPGKVPGAVWVEVQRMLEANKERGAAYKAPRTETALLSGMIRCAECGDYMRPRMYGKPLPDGSRRFHYICAKKVASRKLECSIENAPMDVDQMVVEYLCSLSTTFPGFAEANADSVPASASAHVEESIRKLQAEITNAQRRIDNIVATIADGVPVTVRQRLVRQMDELDEQIQQKQKAIAGMNDTAMVTRQAQDLNAHLKQLFESFASTFATSSYDEKRRAIRSLVDSVVWDGERITINVLGASTLPK